MCFYIVKWMYSLILMLINSDLHCLCCKNILSLAWTSRVWIFSKAMLCQLFNSMVQVHYEHQSLPADLMPTGQGEQTFSQYGVTWLAWWFFSNVFKSLATQIHVGGQHFFLYCDALNHTWLWGWKNCVL